MKTKRKAKIITDITILLCSGTLAACLYFQSYEWAWLAESEAALLVVMALAAMDLTFLLKKNRADAQDNSPAQDMWARSVLLLNEQNEPVKAWDMSGKTSFIIGKRSRDREVDIDLEDCEYSAFIDEQHAVLNYCLDSWYIEDIGSHNGVKIKKSEDGLCYKILNRPCKVAAGDIIYIANTRLLLS